MKSAVFDEALGPVIPSSTGAAPACKERSTGWLAAVRGTESVVVTALVVMQPIEPLGRPTLKGQSRTKPHVPGRP
jgi:hypothetical protein